MNTQDIRKLRLKAERRQQLEALQEKVVPVKKVVKKKAAKKAPKKKEEVNGKVEEKAEQATIEETDK